MTKDIAGKFSDWCNNNENWKENIVTLYINHKGNFTIKPTLRVASIQDLNLAVINNKPNPTYPVIRLQEGLYWRKEDEYCVQYVRAAH